MATAPKLHQQGAPLVSQTVTSIVDLAAEISDTLQLTTGITAGLRVNVDGLVKIVAEDNSAAVTVYMIGGLDYPYRVKQVFSTGTDAAVKTGKIFGLY